MAGGAGEALRELVSDPSFLSVAVLGISVYFALAFAPEPIFTKAPVVLTTLGLMASAAATAREIVETAGAWMALREATENARTLTEIEAAAANFGRSIGATGGRILVALASIVAGHALKATFAGSGTSVAAGGSSLMPAAAGHGSMSAVAVMFKARSGVGVSAVVVPTSMAMAAHAGNAIATGGSVAVPRRGLHITTSAGMGPKRLPVARVGHFIPWDKMTKAQRRAFQHSYSRHAKELGLPNWSQSSAVALQKQFNNIVGYIRNHGRLITGMRKPFNGTSVEVNYWEASLNWRRYYYYETLDGQFISAGLAR
jgi:hypothetical protein